jgi:hypothetical protein
MLEFKMKILTEGCELEEITIFSTSVTNAIKEMSELKPGCKVKNVSLIPKHKDSVIIYSEGEQYEYSRSVLYEPKEVKQ